MGHAATSSKPRGRGRNGNREAEAPQGQWQTWRSPDWGKGCPLCSAGRHGFVRKRRRGGTPVGCRRAPPLLLWTVSSSYWHSFCAWYSSWDSGAVQSFPLSISRRSLSPLDQWDISLPISFTPFLTLLFLCVDPKYVDSHASPRSTRIWSKVGKRSLIQCALLSSLGENARPALSWFFPLQTPQMETSQQGERCDYSWPDFPPFTKDTEMEASV